MAKCSLLPVKSFFFAGLLAATLSFPLLTGFYSSAHAQTDVETDDVETPEESLSEADVLESLQDQLDLQSFEHLKFEERFQAFRQALPFDFFGSLALRYCGMSNERFNVLGNVLQARLSAGVRGEVDEHWSYGLRVLSNQNDNFNLSWFPAGGSDISRIPFLMDRYHVSWKSATPAENSSPWIPETQLVFGKARNTLFETQLLFDEDVSFNGLQQHFRWKNPQAVTTDHPAFPQWQSASLELHENIVLMEGPFVTASLWSARAAGRWQWLGGKLDASLGYLHYAGEDVLAAYTYNPGYRGPYSTGNRELSDGDAPGYTSGFRLLNPAVRWQWQIEGLPEIEAVADGVLNTAAQDRNVGWLLGAHVGSLRKAGDWQVGYSYHWMEQDYQLALMVDEFFAGTDVQGHQLNFNYLLTDSTHAIATLLTRQRITEPEHGMLTILYLTLRQDF